ncbi:MAG: hypothetical protein FJ387_12650 [Verrucomicrobia bacterium]|nr:hypothetical protein [Verrucomicrobiota bacterium]
MKTAPNRYANRPGKMLIILSLLTCSAAWLPAQSLKSEEQPLNLAPFALPGTPANEVRFEEPREIREVVVVLKSAVPDNIGLSYLHKTWRRKRQELLDPSIGSFQMGWKVMDDWFDVSWDKGAVWVERPDARRAILRFDSLSKEGVPFRRHDVDYRYTLGIRVDGVSSEEVERIEVRTTSSLSRTQIRVALDAGKPATVPEISLSGYNCEVVTVEPETGVERLDNSRLRLLAPRPRAARSFLVNVRHLVSGRRLANDDGLVTFGMGDKTFTISLDALRAGGPIWYEDGGVFVTLAGDATTFAAYQREVEGRSGLAETDGAAGEVVVKGSIAPTVAMMPEQSLSGVKQGQPERQPVAMMLGCKYNRNRYRIEVNGDVTMQLGNYGSDDAHRFMFGLGRWSRIANYTDPAPVLIYHVERRNGALRVHQESFAVALLKPVDAVLDGEEPTVCLVRFTFKNEGAVPVDAALPVEFSSRARHSRNVYQGGERSADPTAPRAPLATRAYPNDVIPNGAEQLLVATLDGTSVVRGAISTGMEMASAGNTLLVRQTLSPGEGCEVVLKVTRTPITTTAERAALAGLDYDALRPQTARLWNDEVAPWAELKTPEPDLNAFHKAHLAHQMIADHRMPGEEGLISTSVGPDAYLNFGNESAMVIQELEERGLHEDVRKRLTLWLKYQGTAKLAGRFSEQEGVFYGSGGTESGESYVQNPELLTWYCRACAISGHFP